MELEIRSQENANPACRATSRQVITNNYSHRLRYRCGAAGTRTLVQTKYPRAFYMLSLCLDFRDLKRHKNKPGSNPYPLKFCSVVEKVYLAKPEFGDMRYVVYQASNIRHKGFLIPRIRQP